MLNQDEWTWPSTDCNGIPLIDPVTVSFQGALVLFARQQGVPVSQLYANVRVAGRRPVQRRSGRAGTRCPWPSRARPPPRSSPARTSCRCSGWAAWTC